MKEAIPKISVIIPARNEECTLPVCLAALKASQEKLNVPLEVIVVVNRSSDRTEEVARLHNCVVLNDDSKNLSAIRNRGCRAARGEIIITVDADSRVSPTLLPYAVRLLERADVVGGGVLILPERWSVGILLTGLLLVPLILLYGISGGAFFFRKEDFEAIDGFNEKLSSAEDIDFAKRLKAHGRRTGRTFKNLFRAYIITSCRKFDHFGDWYFIRNPRLTLRLLRGTDQRAADKIWYDFPR